MFSKVATLTKILNAKTESILYVSQLFLDWASQVTLTEKNPSADAGDTVDLIPGKIPWRRNGSSILAWRIQWTEEPGGLQSMGLQRVGQD